MSDGDSGDDNDASAGSATRRGGSGFPSWDVLRRAMRWETLAVPVFLVVLAAPAS
ncbi:hypothetical protein ACWGLP_26115 [Streptomyces lydicus]|uniref:hypothetical protein n=1 Tax=Streptomyces lydicus TaxID=47763 RepID=UPI0037D308C4